MSIKLKPCPFCGSEAHIQSQFYDYMKFWGECKACKASAYVKPPDDDTRGGAIEIWNKRVSEKGGLVDELVGALEAIANENIGCWGVKVGELDSCDKMVKLAKQALAKAKEAIG